MTTRYGFGPSKLRGLLPAETSASTSGEAVCLLTVKNAGFLVIGENGDTCYCCRSREFLNVRTRDGAPITVPCPVCQTDQWRQRLDATRSTNRWAAASDLEYPTMTVAVPGHNLTLMTVGGDCRVCRATGTVHLWLSWDGEGCPWTERFPCPACWPNKWETDWAEWSLALEAWL
ncbi:hypothetical protein [Rugosimonospora africana]|uniref:Uncharacterized protein n=1 Tax=Rugosimonospora africana TaxID=556532 RepID=A0A8J3QQY6_9ACTN|nr:hypothetical protein [Rugosimonospora africana]GIH14702.1 hypothetical protein Raf01_28740 [Rugosimonospora africana]